MAKSVYLCCQFDTKQIYKDLIPLLIAKYIENMKQGGLKLYECHGHHTERNNGHGNSMEEVGKLIFNIQDQEALALILKLRYQTPF
jgi:hypothetical protein